MSPAQTAADATAAPNPADAPQQAHSLVTLPRDVQLCILARCGTPDLAAVAVTCSRLRAVAQTNELWRGAADRAIAWKPAIAKTLRAVIAHTHWLQRLHDAPCDLGSTVAAPAVRSDTSNAAHRPAADGGEWLLTRAGSRLRILSIQLRHTELGVTEACLSFCRDVLQLWLDQGQPHATASEAILHGSFALRNRNHLQHFLQTFRIAATLVADSIALQLRALLMSSSRISVERSHVLGNVWSWVHAAAAAYNAWLRSVASAVGGLHLMRAGVDPLGDLNMSRGGAAAFRSQVLLAYPMRAELQRCAAADIWRLHSQPGSDSNRATAPAADLVLIKRLAMECSKSRILVQARQPEATVEELTAEVAAMARLLDAFDVTDERRSYWWNRDGTHASARLQRHFGFVLRAGQAMSVFS